MGAADTVSTVFAPELFVLVATVLLVGSERHRNWELRGIAVRLGVVAAAWLVAFAVYRGGEGIVPVAAPGGEDFFATLGLIVAFAGIRVAWRRFDWGTLVPPYALLLIGTSLLHLVVVPVWDVSSHVIYATVPVGALIAVDRQFAPLTVVPLLLVWSRVATGAHTVEEVVGGLVVAMAVLGSAVAFDRLPTAENRGAEPL